MRLLWRKERGLCDMTQNERITKMSLKERAILLTELNVCSICYRREPNCQETCKYVKGTEEWLNSEVEDNEN